MSKEYPTNATERYLAYLKKIMEANR